MKIKRSIAAVLALCMLATTMPAFAAEVGEQQTIEAEVYYHMDFNSLEEGTTEIPGWTNIKGPELGTVSIATPEGETDKAICIDDVDTADGPYIWSSIDAITGRKTVQFRYFTGHQSAIDFGIGTEVFFRVELSSDGKFKISNTKAETYEMPLPDFRMPDAGRWIDVSVSFDMKKRKADFFMRFDDVAEYMGTVGPNTQIYGDTVYIPGIPLMTDMIDRINIGYYKNVGTGYFQYLTIYEGLHAPIVLPEETAGAVTDIKQPLKAPWISRTETIGNYVRQNTGNETDGTQTAVGIAGRLTPLPLNIEQYLPAEGQIEKSMAEKKDQHPRLLLDDAGWEAIRAKKETSGGAEIYNRVIAEADALIAEPLYELDPQDTAIDDTQRMIGDHMMRVVFAYKLTGDQRYFDDTLKWAKMACELPSWGPSNSDLAAGHILTGMAYFYDWCYDEISDADKKLMRDTMISRGNDMYEAAAIHKRSWADAYKQNHNWINLGGLAAAGVAIYEDYADAQVWLDHVATDYAYVMDTLGTDGAGHEGVGYWGYGLTFILLYLDLSRSVYGLDLYDHEWLQNTAFFRIYMSYAQNGWTDRKNNFGFGDAWEYDYNGPASLLHKMAAEYNLPQAQWFARQTVESGINKTGDAWLSMMWYDPEVAEESVETLPTLHYFDDLGMVSARSDWSGDESVLYMRCGPYLGFEGGGKALSLPTTKELGMAHVHPDNNHFILYANGEVLIRDDSYTKKYSNSHNTLLVNGKGQKGEDMTWFNNNADSEVCSAKPEIKKVVSTDEYDYFVGDATQAYPMSEGLERFYRHMVYLKQQNVLLVLDDVRVDQAKPLELRLFPESQNISEIAPNEFMVTSTKSNLHIKELTPEGVTAKAEMVQIARDRNGGEMNRFAITMKTDSKQNWLNATSLAWEQNGKMPAVVTCTQEGSAYRFTVNDKIVMVNPVSMSVEITSGIAANQSSADLTSVLINGRPLPDFESETTDYTFDPDADGRLVRMTMDDYSIMAIPLSAKATVTVDMPERIDQMAVIHVTSADGTASKDYRIQFTGDVFRGEAVPVVSAYAAESGPGTAPDDTLDGDYISYWAADGEGKYIEYDLGEERDLIGVDIAWHLGNERQAYFGIETSTDGVNFTERYRGESSGKYIDPQFYEFDTIEPVRYVRVVGYGNSQGSTWHSVAEFGAYISNEISVLFNGKKLSFDVSPIMVNDRVLVPMRAIFEAFGAGVSWDAQTQTVYAVSGSTVMRLPVGGSSAFIGTEEVPLDVAPVLTEDRVLVPIRFVSQSLGAQVEWNGEKKTVIIQTGV